MRKAMKKRAVSCICTLVLALGLMMSTGLDTKASDNRPMLDGSYLTNETESTGTDVKLTRGENLQTGYSKIRKLTTGELYAGGTTIASHVVPEVGIGVMIERAKEEDTKWTFYDSWQKFNENADRASSKKYLDVEGDYYYRVRCIHSAGEDMSSSFTNGVYIEEP